MPAWPVTSTTRPTSRSPGSCSVSRPPRTTLPPALAAELRETQVACNLAMQELLRLARELRPSALDDHGLEAALRTQVERFGNGDRRHSPRWTSRPASTT